jgi:tRNA dimethylallyltransferase
MSTKYLICVLGPTASGKTKLAIEAAKYFNTEIISSDSRQFYTEMNIGTAKPTAEELTAAKHHFINFLSVADSYSAGDFERDALKKIDEIHLKNDIAILVGGSGLYINAVLFGIDPFPIITLETRQKAIEVYKQGGIEALKDALRKLDPEYYIEVDLDNHRRLIRALEVCYASGTTYSSFRKQEAKNRNFKVIKIAYDFDREKLYERIDTRVDEMLTNGLEREVKELLAYKDTQALNTIGYKEFFQYFEGESSMSDTIEAIKRNSRKYAKRQLTWFRSDTEIKWISPSIVYKNLFEMLKLEMK